MKTYLFRTAFCLLMCVLVVPVAAARTIEFETTEVTAADVALSPDGHWLIFTLLGHLFRLPVAGGTAEQLTFGPYYDTDPVFSPDGTQVAFVSDRDGSDGNVFVLELATGELTQVTREAWAARPAWRPDGQSIVYLSLVREVLGVAPLPRHSIPDTVPALVRRVAANGGQPETICAPPRLYRSLTYLKMVDALILANKPHDLIILPGQGHGGPEQALSARYVREAIRRYFQEHLKP